MSSNPCGLLKIIFLMHLILSSWGMQSAYTVPTSYLYTNLVFMLVLIWAIGNRGSAEATGMAFLVNATIFVIDVITMSVYWPRGERHRLYLGFAIANTFLRPITCLLLYRIFGESDTQGGGIRGLFGDALDMGILSNFNTSGGREYRGTAGVPPMTSTAVPTPPGTTRMGYEPIDPAKMFSST